MEKYIVVEIQTDAGGNVSTLTKQYDTENAAGAMYHTILAAAAASNLPCHACIMFMGDGSPRKWESYRHEV